VAAPQGELKISVRPLKEPTANGNRYIRASTAELKPYSRTGKKFRKKLKYTLLLRYCFTFTAQKMMMAIVQLRSIFKIQKPPAMLIYALGYQ
jgi:hypothetical protein